MQVRGTPASGKSTLAALLAHHILDNVKNVDVIFVNMWPAEGLMTTGGYDSYLRERGWTPGKDTVFIFDNAEVTYTDADLWSGLFKSIHDYLNRRAILFSSYGSPNSLVDIRGTLIYLDDSQRVTLRPVDHQDDLSAVGLLLSRDEFNDLIEIEYPYQEYPNLAHHFHQSFFDNVFAVTNGHVGAVRDFISIITAHSVGRCGVNRTDELTPYFSRIVPSGKPVAINDSLGISFWRELVRLSF